MRCTYVPISERLLLNRLLALPAAIRGDCDAYLIKQAVHQGDAHLAIALAVPTHGGERFGNILSLGNAHGQSDGLNIAGIGTKHTYTPQEDFCFKYRGLETKRQEWTHLMLIAPIGYTHRLMHFDGEVNERLKRFYDVDGIVIVLRTQVIRFLVRALCVGGSLKRDRRSNFLRASLPIACHIVVISPRSPIS